MDYFRIVDVARMNFPLLANYPKILFAARVVQPIAAAGVAGFTRMKFDKYAPSSTKNSLCNHCIITGASLCVCSSIVFTVACLFQMPIWIKVLSVIFYSVSSKLCDMAYCKKGLLNAKDFSQVRKNVALANVAWPIVGILSDIVVALAVEGIVVFNPLILGAVVGLIIESIIKHGYGYCHDKENGGTNCDKKNLSNPVPNVLHTAVSAFGFANHFIEGSLPRFVSSLLRFISIIEIALSFLFEVVFIIGLIIVPTLSNERQREIFSKEQTEQIQ